VKALLKYCSQDLPSAKGAGNSSGKALHELHLGNSTDMASNVVFCVLQVGQAVLGLQRALPGARVVYCSATGASEPRNLGYMERLGLWGPGIPSFTNFQVSGLSCSSAVCTVLKPADGRQ